ncbi:esterase [Streptomyces sp. NBC_00439]|uniref:esterase n=1 Tax=Streptomyces sp. NBC_00439 TaxID=2903650 RepID=UPI002B1E1C2F|nr:esterase [Streptomyces sp. NBC_00439]
MTNPINAPEVPISSHVLPLHSIAAHPMPSGVRGALVQRVSVLPDGPLDVTWLATESPKLPLGRIRLHWEPASPTGWNVTAHLGLATAEVHLASWPAAPDDWPRLVHPTIREVLGLCAALTVATAALDLSNRLAQV